MVSRRAVLGGAAAIAGGAAGIAYQRGMLDPDGDGINPLSEHGVSDDLSHYLQDVYGAALDDVVTPGERDLLVEVRRIGDATLDTCAMEALVDVFADQGINLSWFEYPAAYDAKRMDARYGDDVHDLLWSEDSFYADMVEPAAKRYMVQAILTPYDELSSTCEGQAHKTYGGFNVRDRLAVHDDPSAGLLMHELGHFGGLDHNEADEYTGVMRPSVEESSELDYSDSEWETFKKRMATRLALPYPRFVHDAVCDQNPNTVSGWIDHLLDRVGL